MKGCNSSVQHHINVCVYSLVVVTQTTLDMWNVSIRSLKICQKQNINVGEWLCTNISAVLIRLFHSAILTQYFELNGVKKNTNYRAQQTKCILTNTLHAVLFSCSVETGEQVDVNLWEKDRLEEAKKRWISTGLVPVPHGGFPVDSLSCFQSRGSSLTVPFPLFLLSCCCCCRDRGRRPPPFLVCCFVLSKTKTRCQTDCVKRRSKKSMKLTITKPS